MGRFFDGYLCGFGHGTVSYLLIEIGGGEVVVGTLFVIVILQRIDQTQNIYIVAAVIGQLHITGGFGGKNIAFAHIVHLPYR